MAGDSVTTKSPRGVPTTIRTDDVAPADNTAAKAANPTQLEAPPTTRVAVESSGSVQQTRTTGGAAVEVFAQRRGRVRQRRLRVDVVKPSAVAVRAFQSLMGDVGPMLTAYRGAA
ncbi:MAG: hypothetical protein RIT81_13755 [Deltaproteobacteria bacterium]